MRAKSFVTLMVMILFLSLPILLCGAQAPTDPPSGGATIGDVLKAKVGADKAADDAAKALAAAIKSEAAAKTAQDKADADVKAGLAATGPVFVVNADGSVYVWIPDASDAGFHLIQPVPASTTLPAPTSTPTKGGGS